MARTTSSRTRTRRRIVAGATATAALCAVTPAAFAAINPSDNGVTTLVTASTTGAGWGEKTSTRARISQDGNYVVYQSAAQNLTDNRGGGVHVYLTDISGQLGGGANHTLLVDADATDPRVRCKTKTGTNGQSTINEVSNQRGGDGPWVVFSSNCFNLVPGWQHTGDVYLRNMKTGVTQVVSQANGDDTAPIAPVSVRPVISDNGQYVSWNSTNGDIFVRDMFDSSNKRSVKVVSSTGGQDESLRPEISGDGSHLIFASDARLAPQDTNSSRNVYLVDLSGWQANKNNTTFTPQLVDVTATGSAAPRPSSRPGINRDGSIVTYQSSSPLVPDDTNGVLDSYWRNMTTGKTVLVSRGYAGDVPKGQSSRPQLDDSGYVVAFTSTSNGLVRGDTNGRPDAFIRVLDRSNPANGTTYAISQMPNGDTAGALDDCADSAPVAARATSDSAAEPNDAVESAADGGTSTPGVITPMARPGNQNISTRPYIDGDASRVVFVSGMCDLVNPVTDGVSNQIYVRTYGSGGPMAARLGR